MNISPVTAREIVAGIPEQWRQKVSAGGNRYGLIVAIGTYLHDDPVKPKLRLPFAAADGRAMFDVMVDPACGMFSEKNVTLPLDDHATKNRILEELNRLRDQAGKEDTVWICFICHKGEEGGKWFVVPYEGDVKRLRSTGLRNAEIAEVVSEIKADRVLTFWDYCYAMATEQQERPFSFREGHKPDCEIVFGKFSGKGRLALAGSDASQRSLELTELEHGVFTHFVTEALKGKADANGDGVVTLDEFWPYVAQNVAAAARKYGYEQTPWKQGSGDDDSKFPLTLNRELAESRIRIRAAIQARLGFGPEELTPVEAGLCLEILERGPLAGPSHEHERKLHAQFEALAEGTLNLPLFKMAVQLAGAKRTVPEVDQFLVVAEKCKADAQAEQSKLDALHQRVLGEQAELEKLEKQKTELERTQDQALTLLHQAQADAERRQLEELQERTLSLQSEFTRLKQRENEIERKREQAEALV